MINDLKRAIIKRTEELDSGIRERAKIIKRLQANVSDNEETKREDQDSNVISDTYDTTEEGEVKPSEDELTNVHYSETDTVASTPIPGPSRTCAVQTKIPDTPTKNAKPTKKKISPIKYPEVTERRQHGEDFPCPN